eukprot:12377771-Alexandrium_andersonii.AAC.1
MAPGTPEDGLHFHAEASPFWPACEFTLHVIGDLLHANQGLVSALANANVAAPTQPAPCGA